MSTDTVTLTLDKLDELHTLQCCLSVVADLMIPNNNLSNINRDELACLLGYLTNRYGDALKGIG